MRCQGYDCYVDGDCDDGYECLGEPGWCQLIDPIPVCDRQPLTLSAIPTQGPVSALALADLDGDAALDLVAVLAEQGQVEVRLGDGLGGFAPGELFATELSGGVQRLAVADFDGDGSLDLALTREAPVGELSLLFGADAVFAAPVKDSLGDSPTRLWTGDFDGDGSPDLLAQGGDPAVPIALRLGDGMGGFGEAFAAEPLSGMSFSAAVGSVSNDPTRLDLLATRGAAIDALEFSEGVGLSIVETITAGGSHALKSIVTGDVDGDGVADVIGHLTPAGADVLTVWSLKQAGPDLRVDGPIVLGPVADVDGDGAGDLVTGLPGAVQVVFVAGGVCRQSHALAGGAWPELMASGDVDGDGGADVIAGGPGLVDLALLRSGP